MLRIFSALALTALVALGAPFSHSFLFRASAGTGSGSDLLQQQFAGLSVDTWSSDLIAAVGGRHFADCTNSALLGVAGNCLVTPTLTNSKYPVAPAAYNAYYGYGGYNPPTSSVPWAYSSGALMPDLNAYIACGMGGHDDWLGSQCEVFQFANLTWNMTDDSAQYAAVRQPGSASAPFQPVCPSGPGTCPYTWPNKEGRFAPSASHMYGGEAYCSNEGLVSTFGGSPWLSPGGTEGGIGFVIASTGQWENPPSHTTANSTYTAQNTTSFCIENGQPQAGGPTAPIIYLMSVYQGTPVAVVFDLSNLTFYNSNNYYHSEIQAAHVAGALIPDPFHTSTGRAPCVIRCRAFMSVGGDASSRNIYIAPEADVIGQSPLQNGRYETVTTALPSAARNPNSSSDTCGRAIYMGYDRPGSQQVVFWSVFDPGHLYYINDIEASQPLDGWNSVAINGMPPTMTDEAGGDCLWNKFFYLAKYDVFGVFVGITVADVAARFYVFKRPSVIQ